MKKKVQDMEKIGVLGAGAWGTALAVHLAKAGKRVSLFSSHPETCDAINQTHRHPTQFEGIDLPKELRAENIETLAKENALDALLITTPTQKLRSTLREQKAKGFKASMPLVLCSKGMESNTHALVHEILRDLFAEAHIAILSGPNFAEEIMRGLPAITSLACKDPEIRRSLSAAIGTERLRVYGNEDVIGTAMLGAGKNVLAIACGIAAGKGFGENARAAIISRGMVELKRLVMAAGGKADTLLEPCGAGDIILTCSSRTSRNMAFGYALGKGASTEEAMRGTNGIVEGAFTAQGLQAFAQEHGVDTPILSAVYEVVSGTQSAEQAVRELLARPI